MILWLAEHWLLFLLLWLGGLASGVIFCFCGALYNVFSHIIIGVACYIVAGLSWIAMIASFIINLVIFAKG